MTAPAGYTPMQRGPLDPAVAAGHDGPLPFLVSWNLTKRCNLRCAHCYLDARELEGTDETPAGEALKVIDQIASLNRFSMLILTGGEPLLRPDFFDLSSYASEKGLTVVVGTNGTMLDGPTVDRMAASGVKGAGISLDSPTPSFHDRFRGLPGAWERTSSGMDELRRAGLPFQVQFTVTKGNRADLPGVIKFAAEKGAKAVNVFFLVCTGRGQNITDLTPREYEETLRYLAGAEREYEGTIMVRARCAPHFIRIAGEMFPDSPIIRGETSGCIAGTGYLRISPERDVTPCPYIPPEKSANLKDKDLWDIWFNHPSFVSLRGPRLSGRCGDCEFAESCGGCRARSLASGNGLLGEDPWCGYEPEKKNLPAERVDPVWTEEAKKRLSTVPIFLRGMVKKGVEGYARAKGVREITPDLMGELRNKASGGMDGRGKDGIKRG